MFELINLLKCSYIICLVKNHHSHVQKKKVQRFLVAISYCRSLLLSRFVRIFLLHSKTPFKFEVHTKEISGACLFVLSNLFTKKKLQNIKLNTQINYNSVIRLSKGD